MNISELEKWLDRYYEVFGENYPLVITSSLSDEEHIAIIQKCIDSGEPAEKPKYRSDADY